MSSHENWFGIMKKVVEGDPEAERLAQIEKAKVIADEANIPAEEILAQEGLVPSTKTEEGHPLPREAHWHGAMESAEEERIERWHREHPDGNK